MKLTKKEALMVCNAAGVAVLVTTARYVIGEPQKTLLDVFLERERSTRASQLLSSAQAHATRKGSRA